MLAHECRHARVIAARADERTTRRSAEGAGCGWLLADPLDGGDACGVMWAGHGITAIEDSVRMRTAEARRSR